MKQSRLIVSWAADLKGCLQPFNTVSWSWNRYVSTGSETVVGDSQRAEPSEYRCVSIGPETKTRSINDDLQSWYRCIETHGFLVRRPSQNCVFSDLRRRQFRGRPAYTARIVAYMPCMGTGAVGDYSASPTACLTSATQERNVSGAHLVASAYASRHPEGSSSSAWFLPAAHSSIADMSTFTPCP